MNPAIIAALATITASAAQGGGQALSGASSARAEKKRAKESKRQTLADMYNKALQRQFDQYRFDREQDANSTSRRSSALQDTANGFSRSLLKG